VKGKRIGLNAVPLEYPSDDLRRRLKPRSAAERDDDVTELALKGTTPRELNTAK
jgi:hypothetical protein